jgi:hypothetical protein
MKKKGFRAGTSLVEMMISIAVSVIVIGALLTSSMAIQKAIHGSEVFANGYSDQRRVTDYIARDLRRSLAVAATDALGVRCTVGSDAITIADLATLVVSVPGYYKSNDPNNSDFNQALPVIETDERLDYGTPADGFAPPVEVSFRKVFLAAEGCVCFVRQEAGVDEVIVRKAENLFVQVSISADGRTGTVKTWFRGAYSSTSPLVCTFDELMLRNAPLDFNP